MGLPFIATALSESQRLVAVVAKERLLLEGLERAIASMVQCLSAGGKLLSCGNGGSMCDAMHFAQELTGRYLKHRSALAAMALGGEGHMTCVGNDYGFDHIFSRQVAALGRQGDCLLAISTSGNSPNVIMAVEKARELGLSIIGLLGKQGGKLGDLVDIALVVPHQGTDRIQEMHGQLIHILIEGIERALYPELYG